MKFYTLILITIITLTLSGCQSDNIDTGLTVSEYQTQQENLESNTPETMENYQTKKLEDGDKVAVMKTTNGTMTIKLFTQDVPATALNFMAHAQNGYYNGLIFHRVINNFMIQGGDPEGTGRGGVSIYGEKFEDEFSPKLKNIPFSLSMANAGPNTNGSQFFINQVANTHLDNKHSVFGQVVEGMDNVNKIAKTKVGAGDKPVKDIKIISLDIKEYQNGTLKDYVIDIEAEKANIGEQAQAAAEASKQANKDRVVQSGDDITVDYKGTLSNGEQFDSSYDRGQPLEFTVGAQMMIKGFDAGVVGMKIGEKKTLTLVPSEAYGEKEINIPKADLKAFEEAGFKLEVGVTLPTAMGEIEILAADDTSVTIENTHELAGETLIFEVEIVDFKN